ncbi:MAG: hypothetical protein K2X01_01995 [Cyanobacteria bacterium]|nr:hypothetical protein [Cyanobacteriota bacterium]
MSIVNRFPISARLIPSRENLFYLASTAVLTRLCIAGARVWQNLPSKNHNPEYTTTDKYTALWERMFVEFFGTAGYMAAIHGGMDSVAKLFERSTGYQIPVVTKSIAKQLGKPLAAVNQAIKETYGEGSHGLISRVLFKQGNLASLEKKLGISLSDAKAKGLKDLFEPFARKINRAASLSTLSGVLTGALFGGFVIQILNDRIFAPFIAPAINNLFAIGGNSRPISKKPSAAEPNLNVQQQVNSLNQDPLSRAALVNDEHQLRQTRAYNVNFNASNNLPAAYTLNNRFIPSPTAQNAFVPPQYLPQHLTEAQRTYRF